MQYLLAEDDSALDLQPFTFTRPVFALRCGITTLAEKWAACLPQKPGMISKSWFGNRFNSFATGTETTLINGKFIPHTSWVAELLQALEPGTILKNEKGEWIAARLLADDSLAEKVRDNTFADHLREIPFPTESISAIRQLADLFLLNGACIKQDFEILSKAKPSASLTDPHSRVYGKDNIWIGEGVKIRAAILNAEDGPIYIADGTEIQEGAIIHGTHAIGTHAVVNMGAKLRGDSTLGPWCKVGGELSNSILMGYSNKGHDGFVGNSVIGYWCNLGADTNTSNLKNNYAPVKIWSYRKKGFASTGQLFCGLMMGDHSKCGINTMFNTGTVVGVSANIFGDGFPRNFIPSFSWGGAAGFTTFKLKDALEVARIVMDRRNVTLDAEEIQILTHIFELDSEYRK